MAPASVNKPVLLKQLKWTVTQAFYAYTTPTLDQATTARTGEKVWARPSEEGLRSEENQQLISKSGWWVGAFRPEMSKDDISVVLVIDSKTGMDQSSSEL